METKNNKTIVGLLALFVILTLLLGGYIIYDKVVTKPTNENLHQNTETPEGNNDDTTCVISSNIVLKNIRDNNGRTTSDVYINDKLASQITYDTNGYNECDGLNGKHSGNIEEKGNYYLFSFSNEAAMYSDFYLFNKNGKYISNFEEARKKYNSDYYALTVSINEDNELLIVYDGIYGYDSIFEAYCEHDAKPNDISIITEYVSIENDELILKNVKKETWKDAYLCTSNNTENCGDIEKVECNS